MDVKDIGNEDEQPDEDDNLDEIYLDDLFAYEYLSSDSCKNYLTDFGCILFSNYIQQILLIWHVN